MHDIPVKEKNKLSSEEIIAKHNEYLFPGVFNYYKEPLAIDTGEGVYVYDPEGNKYLDFFGGILTVSVGHCNPKVTEKMSRQTSFSILPLFILLRI
jgi:4-aminobutyrate aminotransferase-like enzyme